MKFIRKFILIVILLVAISGHFLWTSFAPEDDNSVPHSRRRSKIVEASTPAPIQTTSAALARVRKNDTLIDAIGFLLHLFISPTQTQTHISRARPSLEVSQHRSSVDLVIGIPSIQRKKENYLNATLKALLYAMNDDERRKVLIIVLLGDLDSETVRIRYKELFAQFGPEISSGLIDIVSPPESFYSDIKSTSNGSSDQVKWHAKQARDFAYIMMHAMNRGEYFLQLEDDIIATKQFTTRILGFAKEQDKSLPDWLYIQFARLGCIGKLFHNRDLLSYSLFYMLFHTAKPVDFLLPQYAAVKVCADMRGAALSNGCTKTLKNTVVTYLPPLFQHIGYYSSLDGSVQKLKERQFSLDGSVNMTVMRNPAATLNMSMKHVDTNSLQAVYQETGLLWMYPPVQNDFIEINLTPPVELSHFEIISGSAEAPTDLLEAATVEVKPANASISLQPNGTLPGYFVLASFNERGIASGEVPAVFGKIRTFRVNVHSEHAHWVAVSAFHLET